MSQRTNFLNITFVPFMTLYERYMYLEVSYNFNIISALCNTVSCFYRTPADDENLFVRNS